MLKENINYLFFGTFVDKNTMKLFSLISTAFWGLLKAIFSEVLFFESLPNPALSNLAVSGTCRVKSLNIG